MYFSLAVCTQKKSGYRRQPAGFMTIALMLTEKKPSQVQQGSVKTSCSATPATASQTVLVASLMWKMFTSHIHHHLHLYLLLLLSISPFRTPQIFPLSSVAGSGLMAMSAWTLFWWCIQFLASSSYLWLLIPTLIASFQLCQHKHLCSCAGNQIGELIQLKITPPRPSQFSGRAVADVAGW